MILTLMQDGEMLKNLTSVQRLMVETAAMLFPLTTGSAGSTSSSRGVCAEIRRKKPSDTKNTRLLLLIRPKAVNILHRKAFMCPAAVNDQNRSAPTGHVGIGPIKLSVPLHYLVFLSFAASMQTLQLL